MLVRGSAFLVSRRSRLGFERCLLLWLLYKVGAYKYLPFPALCVCVLVWVVVCVEMSIFVSRSVYMHMCMPIQKYIRIHLRPCLAGVFPLA